MATISLRSRQNFDFFSHFIFIFWEKMSEFLTKKKVRIQNDKKVHSALQKKLQNVILTYMFTQILFPSHFWNKNNQKLQWLWQFQNIKTTSAQGVSQAILMLWKFTSHDLFIFLFPFFWGFWALLWFVHERWMNDEFIHWYSCIVLVQNTMCNVG